MNTRQKHMRWKIMILSLNLAILAINAAEKAPSTHEFLESLNMPEFGITTGVSMDKGFIFHNGKYLDIPYVVARKGTTIFINEILIEGPFSWPRECFEQNEDANVPEEIHRDGKFEDVRYYFVKKFRYLSSHYPEKDAITRFIADLKTLPCVKSIGFIEGTKITCTLFSGEIIPLDLSVRGKRGIQNKEDFLIMLEQIRESYECGLRKGKCYIFDNSGGGTLSFVASDKIEQMAKLIKVLRSSKSIKEKSEDILRMEQLNIKGQALTILINNFQASSQLEERLESLLKEKALKDATLH